jgi:hypothetical protein
MLAFSSTQHNPRCTRRYKYQSNSLATWLISSRTSHFVCGLVPRRAHTYYKFNFRLSGAPSLVQSTSYTMQLHANLVIVATAFTAIYASPTEKAVRLEGRFPHEAVGKACSGALQDPYACGWCHYYYKCLDYDKDGEWTEPWSVVFDYDFR